MKPSSLRAVLAVAALTLAAMPALAEDAPVVPGFVEETAEAGIDSVYSGEWEFMVGGGAATFDCNDDGYPDMLLAGGAGPARFYRNAGTSGGPLRFVAERSGLELDGVAGVYPLDVDGDGITDLVLLRVGENVAMRGRGECRFERANEAWGFDGGDAWSTAFAATWERGEQWPTFAVGNYIDRTQDAFPWGSCTDNWLHRPGTGDERRRFAAPVALKPSYCSLSMLFTDWGRVGTPALRVSNDREYYKGGQEQLWRLEPGVPPSLYRADDGWKPLRIWGMGIAGADLDADGYPEYFLTSMADNKLQSLVKSASTDAAARPTYADVAFARGVTAHRPYTGGEIKPSTAWHAQFEDVNNDGRMDLFVAKGNVSEMPDFAMKDPNNLLIQESDGRFREVGEEAGVASFRTSRGAALADFNLDGLLDLVVVNRGDKAQLWRNASRDAGRFVAVKLRQEGPNRDAAGAWIELRRDKAVSRREITVGGGHAGGQSGWIHFGLGQSGTAELRVLWPGGEEGEWQPVEADGFYIVERGKPPTPWQPR